jgi:hypothetical protein
VQSIEISGSSFESNNFFHKDKFSSETRCLIIACRYLLIARSVLPAEVFLLREVWCRFDFWDYGERLTDKLKDPLYFMIHSCLVTT